MKLAIDTSTKQAVIAIESDGEIVARYFQPRATQKVIFGELSSMLEPDTLAQLDGIAVGLGPGSFTGVKIGVMSAKTLSWARNIPIVGVGSLDAVAASTPAHENPEISLVVAVPSTKGEAYIRIYRLENGRWIPMNGILDTIIEKDSLDSILPDGRLLLSGEACDYVAEAVEAVRKFEKIHEDFRTPRAEGLFSLANERFISGEIDDPIRLIPDYIRLSQPERLDREAGK